jgi:hypothetical protein
MSCQNAVNSKYLEPGFVQFNCFKQSDLCCIFCVMHAMGMQTLLHDLFPDISKGWLINLGIVVRCVVQYYYCIYRQVQIELLL